MRNYEEDGVYITLYGLGESGFLHYANSFSHGVGAYTYIDPDVICYVQTLRKARALPVRGVHE